jgi:hypothetical protein
VINDLANGNVLLTSAEKAEMNAPASSCIGWDCSVRRDCPDPYLCKNGSLHNNNLDGSVSKIWTYAGILNCATPVVVIVNSALPPPYDANGDIIGLVKDAYNDAAVEGTPKSCSNNSPPCGGNTPNACGGCSTLAHGRNTPCKDETDKCGQYECVGTDAVTCRESSQYVDNGCGACSLAGVAGQSGSKGDGCEYHNPLGNDVRPGFLTCAPGQNGKASGTLQCCPIGGNIPRQCQ